MLAVPCAIRRPGWAIVARPKRHAVNAPAILIPKIFISLTPTLSSHSYGRPSICSNRLFHLWKRPQSIGRDLQFILQYQRSHAPQLPHQMPHGRGTCPPHTPPGQRSTGSMTKLHATARLFQLQLVTFGLVSSESVRRPLRISAHLTLLLWLRLVRHRRSETSTPEPPPHLPPAPVAERETLPAAGCCCSPPPANTPPRPIPTSPARTTLLRGFQTARLSPFPPVASAPYLLQITFLHSRPQLKLTSLRHSASGQ